ncbi:hypothetical protein I7I50_06840 [Histoplasma capsulatum G186AR]|uniref:Uncharacterized protein n=1 Tax=Ajellomyces capsulatus TaxID=5037 RepID=A0A8H7YYT3_AJECA|nr:hypothetical protein I7I52_10086 [Histoplasma capsulatum]QSS67683.1 hypothetical protein I7I50_06840 [Histoplasma capsulatum G186AR]
MHVGILCCRYTKWNPIYASPRMLLWIFLSISFLSWKALTLSYQRQPHRRCHHVLAMRPLAQPVRLAGR